MSSDEEKFKRSKRLHKEENVIDRQLNIAKQYGLNVKNPNKFCKTHAMTCGDPNCASCGNPRKFFDEKTIQEKRFDQVLD
jgi:hypothetical protein